MCSLYISRVHMFVWFNGIRRQFHIRLGHVLVFGNVIGQILCCFLIIIADFIRVGRVRYCQTRNGRCRRA
jgi:hypothetical protein